METTNVTVTDFVTEPKTSCRGCYFDGNGCHVMMLPSLIYELDKIHGNCIGTPRHIYKLASEVETEKIE
jgi:hypothetical protein